MTVTDAAAHRPGLTQPHRPGLMQPHRDRDHTATQKQRLMQPHSDRDWMRRAGVARQAAALWSWQDRVCLPWRRQWPASTLQNPETAWVKVASKSHCVKAIILTHMPPAGGHHPDLHTRVRQRAITLICTHAACGHHLDLHTRSMRPSP